MAKYYAWSNIHHNVVGDDGHKKVVINPGEEVSQEKLGYNDDEWAELLESGAVRKTEWPKDLDPKDPNALSPNEHRLRELRLQQERLALEIAGVGGTEDTDNEKEDNGNQTQPPQGSRIP